MSGPSSKGGGFLGIRKITCMGCSSLAYGGRPRASSMAVMPMDQMSAHPS